MRKFRGDRNYHIAQQLMGRVRDALSIGIQFQQTIDKIGQNMRGGVIDTQDFARLTIYYQGMVEGYRRSAWESLWKHAYWMLSCDGKLMTSKEVDALTEAEKDISKEESYQSPWSRIDNDQSRHVWKAPDGSPMRDKPFTEKDK